MSGLGFDNNLFEDPNEYYKQKQEETLAIERENEEKIRREKEQEDMEKERQLREKEEEERKQSLNFKPTGNTNYMSGAMDTANTTKIGSVGNQQYTPPNYGVNIPPNITEMSQTDNSDRTPNFPPFPKIGFLRPIFYQNIEIDIPVSYQPLVTNAFRVWMIYTLLLSLSFLWHLIAFFCSFSVTPDDYTTKTGTGWGLSILWFILFVPMSYIIWFRSIYRAFKKDSSLSFFCFFFVSIAQIIVLVVMVFGTPSSGFSGILFGISLAKTTSGGLKFIGAMMIISGFFFALTTAATIYVLLKTHYYYRHTDTANLANAQDEFINGVMSNQAVRRGAANAVRTGVEDQFRR